MRWKKMCESYLNTMNENALKFIEPKILLFPDENCAHSSISLDYAFRKNINERIRSAVIPGHASLRLFKAPDGYAEIDGPRVIPNVEALYDSYHMPHGESCLEAIVCGKKIDWNKPDVQAVRHIDFSQWLHAKEVDLLDQWCTHVRDPSIDCSCHEADKIHRERFPKSHFHIHPGDIGTNGCTGKGLDQQVPKRAQVHWNADKTMEPTKHECLSHLHHLIKNEEWDPNEDFHCGHFVFEKDAMVDEETVPYLWFYSIGILIWTVAVTLIYYFTDPKRDKVTRSGKFDYKFTYGKKT